MTKPISNGNGYHPSSPVIATHRVQHRGQDHLAAIDSAPVLDDTIILDCLSELALAVVRQARADSRHECTQACKRKKTPCSLVISSARVFLRRLKRGYVPDWIADVASAARDHVTARPSLDPYEPRIDREPRHNGIAHEIQA
jgi:hypothetical protein